jgi:hypothetical protein
VCWDDEHRLMAVEVRWGVVFGGGEARGHVSSSPSRAEKEEDPSAEEVTVSPETAAG